MNYETWLDTYKPISNPIVSTHGFDGFMFETYGEELEELKKYKGNQIWTLIDDGESYGITAGARWINRLGYFVCSVPWEDQWEFVDLNS